MAEAEREAVVTRHARAIEGYCCPTHFPLPRPLHQVQQATWAGSTRPFRFPTGDSSESADQG